MRAVVRTLRIFADCFGLMAACAFFVPMSASAAFETVASLLEAHVVVKEILRGQAKR